MALSLLTLAMSQKYTEDSLVGVGAIKGSPCTIKSITKNDKTGINTIVFEWEASNGQFYQQEMQVQDGTNISDIDLDASNRLVLTLTNGTTITSSKAIETGKVPIYEI